MARVKTFWNNLDKKVHTWATRLAAVATIVGVLTASGTWLIHQVDNSLAMRLEDHTASIQQEITALKQQQEESNKQTELQLTRLELMTLMETDPDNIIEIEKIAKKYFQDLKGNAYLSSEYGRWCRKYNADCEVIFR